MAVYTLVPDDELARFVAEHGLGELHFCKGIAEGVENTNYLIETDTGRYILTLYEKRVAPENLPFYLGLMEHLAAKGIACPLPVRDRQGRQVAELGGRAAAIVTFLDGMSVRQPSARHCRLVGEALARLHLAGRDFAQRLDNALGPKGWTALYARFAHRVEEVRPGLKELIETELASVVPAWPRGLPEGVIHADLFPDNAFFLGDRLSGIIDFYFACHDMLAYDIAVSLNAWCFDPQRRFDRAKSTAFLAGYQEVRGLEKAEVAALPILARGAALRFLLTRSHDWLATPADAIVKPHDPDDYVARVLQHREMASAGDYGVEG
jgi:homoserine kinase type II